MFVFTVKLAIFIGHGMTVKGFYLLLISKAR